MLKTIGLCPLRQLATKQSEVRARGACQCTGRTGDQQCDWTGLTALNCPLAQDNAAIGRPMPGRTPRCIVMAPTRELANQVEREFAASAPTLAVGCFYGGACLRRRAAPEQVGLSQPAQVGVQFAPMLRWLLLRRCVSAASRRQRGSVFFFIRWRGLSAGAHLNVSGFSVFAGIWVV